MPPRLAHAPWLLRYKVWPNSVVKPTLACAWPSAQARDILQHARGHEINQAARMSQWAFPFETRRAVQRRLIGSVALEPQHGGPVIQRWCVQRAAGAENGDLRYTQGGRHMHQAGIIAYYVFCSKYRTECVGQSRFSRKVEAFSGLRGIHLRVNFFA